MHNLLIIGGMVTPEITFFLGASSFFVQFEQDVTVISPRFENCKDKFYRGEGNLTFHKVCQEGTL